MRHCERRPSRAKLQEVLPLPSIPLDALFHARYSGKSKQVSLTQSYIRLPQDVAHF